MLRKILIGTLAAVVLVGGGVAIYNNHENNKRPSCNSEEVNEELIKLLEKEFAKTGLTLDGFSMNNITQRPSKVSDNTNVCSGNAYVKFSFFGYATREGDVNITFTAQKTMDDKVKVDVYSVGSKDLKKLND